MGCVLVPGSLLSVQAERRPGLAERLVWDATFKPSGPLGWVSSRWLMPRMARHMYQVLSDALRLDPEDELLEVACGSGAFLAEHAGHVRRVAGIDLSEIQVELARERLEERIGAGSAEVVLGDAGTLPWRDGSFTVVTSMAAFELFPDPPAALAEVIRVLRPGGRVVLTMGQHVPLETQTHQVMGRWVWSEDDVRRLVERAGFAAVTISYASAFGTGRVARTIHHLTGTANSDLRIVGGARA